MAGLGGRDLARLLDEVGASAEQRSQIEQIAVRARADLAPERDTGRSRGFGFVTFESPDGASNAMSAMDGASLDGRTLNVDVAKERSSSRSSYDSRW